MHFQPILTSLLALAATAVSTAIQTTGQISPQEASDLCNNSDFATVFEVRVCQRYNQSKCQSIVYTIQDCSYDRLLYWGCNDDGSGAYDGAGGYYDRVDMIPDTTNMTCVNEGLRQLFPGKTDVKVHATECGDAKDSKMRERAVAVKQVDDKQSRCDYHQEFFYEFYNIQVGAPYDVNHCLEIQSTLASCCLSGPAQGPVETWKCYDDGSTMYNNGDVGAYDISFALHPGHSPCVDAVLNDMFEDVCVNTGRFSCNRGTFADVRDSKTQKRGSLKQVDEDQFRCNSIQDFDRVDSKIQVGAPYNVSHCAKIEAGLVDWCLKGQNLLDNWKCSNDGRTVCKDGTIGAYDIRFAMHTGYGACVDKILNEMFEAVRDTTGGFTCNSDTS